MVQNQRIMVQTRPPRPWGVVNKTQPKARLSRDTFAMSLVLCFFAAGLCCRFGEMTEISAVAHHTEVVVASG